MENRRLAFLITGELQNVSDLQLDMFVKNLVEPNDAHVFAISDGKFDVDRFHSKFGDRLQLAVIANEGEFSSLIIRNGLQWIQNISDFKISKRGCQFLSSNGVGYAISQRLIRQYSILAFGLRKLLEFENQFSCQYQTIARIRIDRYTYDGQFIMTIPSTFPFLSCKFVTILGIPIENNWWAHDCLFYGSHDVIVECIFNIENNYGKLRLSKNISDVIFNLGYPDHDMSPEMQTALIFKQVLQSQNIYLHPFPKSDIKKISARQYKFTA